MKVGITGAAGFLGSHLVDAALGRGHEVRALVHHAPARADVASVEIDLTRGDGLEPALAGLDVLIHAAAYLPRSYVDPAEARPCIEVNALGTFELLRAAERAAVSRFVFVSSGNIYRFDTTPAGEDAPIEPSARAPYYLASKACADLFAQQFHREKRLHVITLRPSAVYGPGLGRGMIASFVDRLIRRERIVIDDGGRYRSDLVYVADVAAAAMAALERPVTGAFNIGSGRATGPLEIAQTLARITDAPLELVELCPPRAEGVFGFAPLAIERAQRMLGYAPRSVQAGLTEYVRWWKAAH